VIFFTNSLCEQCQNVQEFFTTFTPAHPEITMNTYDLVNSPENRTLFENYKTKYQRKFLSTPSVMIGNLTLEGPEDIRKNLPVLVSLQKELGVTAGSLPEVGSPSIQNTETTDGDIPMLLIIGAGLLDGINPCAFAVLVFLLVYLMAQKSRRTMLLAGLVYTSAVFIFYFLSGVGIFSVVQTTGATTAFSIGAGCISLIAGIIMMKDAVFPKDKPTLGIPASQSGLINRVMKRATMPAAFILGILVGMFELPCTGGIYLSIISMISLKSNLSQALGYLFVYNIAFILPLLVILALVTFGLPPERVTEWRLEQRRALRGIIGMVLIGFAIFILYETLT
jgi:cytochrome c biogenesis protein CcdA